MNLPLWVTQYHYPEHIPAISQMADFGSANMAVSYVGLETVQGAPAHHIRFTLVPGDGTPANMRSLDKRISCFRGCTKLSSNQDRKLRLFFRRHRESFSGGNVLLRLPLGKWLDGSLSDFSLHFGREDL